MKPLDVAELLALAALWGAAFLFMRWGHAFGPFAMALTRAAGAALVLMPLLLWRGEWVVLRRHWRPMVVVGVTGSTLPFVLFAHGTVTLGAGVASIFTALTPMWAALICRVWLGERLSRWRMLGMVLGFGGVAWLSSHRSGLSISGDSPLLASLACLGATGLYAYSTVYARKHLGGVSSMALTGGSQLASAALLLVPGLWQWPPEAVGAQGWAAIVALAVVSTGLAYLMFFHLVGNVGPARAVSVTFLVPAFAVAWGVLFLDEHVTPPMLVGCAVVLLGTALSIGLLDARPGVAASGRSARSDAA